MQLGAATRDVHGLEFARFESFEALLERFARHRLGFLWSALEIAMTACQVACIGDVHLHGRLVLAGLEQRGLANALFERQVVSLIVSIFEHFQIDDALALAHLERLLRAFGIECAAVETRRRDLEVFAVARRFDHACRVAAHGARFALYETQFRIEIKVARHFGHAAEVRGVLAVIFFSLFQPVALDGADSAQVVLLDDLALVAEVDGEAVLHEVAQAGVALGMCSTAYRVLGGAEGSLIRNIVLFSVLIYELVGPSLTKWALTRAGDIQAKSADMLTRRQRRLQEITKPVPPAFDK